MTKREFDCTCPYCGRGFDTEFPDFSTDEYTWQEECPYCGKLVNVTGRVQITYNTAKCECQGVDHEWQLTNTFPKELSEMECIHCGERRKLTDEERTQYGVGTIKDYFKRINKGKETQNEEH